MFRNNGITDNRSRLLRIAQEAMLERELLPRFSTRSQAEAGRLLLPELLNGDGRRDLRHLLWSSIDNDDSRDLDQLTAAEELEEGVVKIYVAVADVDALVSPGSAVDSHARHNTTSVYTPPTVFPMIPTELCYDLTSLNQDEDRPAMVVEILIGGDSRMKPGSIYPAVVRNRARLAYGDVGSWLAQEGPLPPAAAGIPGLDGNLRLQSLAARRLRAIREEQGALELQTVQARPYFRENDTLGVSLEKTNPATELIEDLMIAANTVTARFLRSRKRPSLRRVVREPARWDRIADLASEYGSDLPSRPDSRALAGFLVEQRERDPLRFPDLSLSVIKLIGSGEYVVELPGEKPVGHFGLAVRNYTHSTAPNRRYPDLITQRLLKSALADERPPYEVTELTILARHCTGKEDDADKVERKVNKAAAALLLESRIGERFDALVTGAAAKGTWVRVLDPPVEGKLVRGADRVDVGDRIEVELTGTDVERGHIDFRAV